jgi:ATP-dependent RNA helicase DHX8/PRP22
VHERDRDRQRDREDCWRHERNRERDLDCPRDQGGRGGHGRDLGRHREGHDSRDNEGSREKYHGPGGREEFERGSAVRSAQDDADDSRGVRQEEELDGAPEVFKVYRGRVTNTTKFGAFVELFGVRGRAEGMVHISNMASRRINEVSSVCKRGDQVWVKVLGIREPKPGQTRPQIELSMRDVDQSTGTDLLPVHDTEHGGVVGVHSSLNTCACCR